MSTVNIDHPFLSKCLGDRFEVLEFDVTAGSKPGDNYLSLIYAIKVTAREKSTQKPITRYLLLKCYPNHPARQEYNNNANIFHRELEIYRVWLPELAEFQQEKLETVYKLPYPPYIYGRAIDFSKNDPQSWNGKLQDPLENFIMMEDMKKTWGFRMTNRREPLDIHHMRLVIEALARVHALSWGYKHHVESDIPAKFPFLRNSFRKEDYEMWIAVTTPSADQAISVLEKELGNDSPLVNAAKNFKGNLRTLLRIFMGDDMTQALRDLARIKRKDSDTDEKWNVITHGDCWSNNLLFRYDQSTGRPVEVTLLDLQLAQNACITNDLAYLIYASTRTDLRKKHLNELLELYFDTFNSVCDTLACPSLPGFTMDSFTSRFHRAKLAGYMFGIVILPVVLKDEADAVNMEELDPNKDITEIFTETVSSGNSGNALYAERILELTKELYEEGVI